MSHTPPRDGAARPRRITHPGPVHPVRIESFSAARVSGEIHLQAGEVLIAAIGAAMTARGLRSAALDLVGLTLGPMDFVMPTYSTSPEHVAYYSETYHRDGPVAIAAGTATYGARDGAPFLHGHVLWRDADGREMGGHVLPFECRIARDCTIRYAGCREIAMEARPDTETNFTLFGPHAEVESHGDLIVARARPNEDLTGAILEIAARHDIGTGRILSLIGSTVGARFDGGPAIDAIPTEILGLKGRIGPDGAGGTGLELEIALIDAGGHIHIGRPVPGDNPILILAELFIERLSGRQGGALP